MGFNSFPEFADQWVPLEGGGWGETTEENMAIYMRRCYPTIEQIVTRIEEIRRSPAGRGLKDIFIMTNGKLDWVQELKDALFAMGGWEKIASSRDMVITKEQKEVAQAVDMMIGERAQVIIGNGVSRSVFSSTKLRPLTVLLATVVQHDVGYRHDADDKRATYRIEQVLVGPSAYLFTHYRSGFGCRGHIRIRSTSHLS